METSVIPVKAALLSFVLFLAMGQEVTAGDSYYVKYVIFSINDKLPGIRFLKNILSCQVMISSHAVHVTMVTTDEAEAQLERI